MGQRKIFEYFRLVLVSGAVGQGTIYLAWLGWTYEEPTVSSGWHCKDVVSMPGVQKLGLQLDQAKQATQKFSTQPEIK